MPLAGAPRHAASARTEVHKLPPLQAPTSMRSPRSSHHAMGSTACRLPPLVPCPPGNAQQQDMPARAKNWEADQLVPMPPLQPAHKTTKSLALAYLRRPVAAKMAEVCQKPVAARPKPCWKPAPPQQGPPTRTVGAPRTTAPVLVPEAGSGPADEVLPDPSAQEGVRDADGASTAAQQAADDGAEAAGIPWGMPSSKDVEKKMCSWVKEHMFLPCLLCASRDVVLVDVQEERKDTPEREAAAEAADVSLRTPSGEAEAQPAASAVSVHSQDKVSKAHVVGNRCEMVAGCEACVVE